MDYQVLKIIPVWKVRSRSKLTNTEHINVSLCNFILVLFVRGSAHNVDFLSAFIYLSSSGSWSHHGRANDISWWVYLFATKKVYHK